VPPPVDPVGSLVPDIGEEPVRALVAAFYRRIPGDELLGPMYPARDLAGAEERLRDFLVRRFGGPDAYSRRRGHPRLRMRHAPFAIDRRARDRWMEHMDAALEETAMPADARTRIRAFLAEVATSLINR
jgi:hemoglobin